MTEKEFNQQKAAGNIKQLEQPVIDTTNSEKPNPLAPDFETYLAVLEAMQRPKRHLSSTPDFIPKNLAEQIQFYDSGSVRRVYFYINGTWRYSTLT